jgi:non-homologous end joining protein Ku
VYSLLQDKATKFKVSEIFDRYQQRIREIQFRFSGINHSTAKGEECRKAFAQAHNDIVIDLLKLQSHSVRK